MVGKTGLDFMNKLATRNYWQVKHGEATSRNGKASPECSSYYAARQRCNNPNAANYKHYGGRGIQFRFASFAEFLAEIGRRPTLKHTLDRINSDGHYEPGNVRWATMKEQSRNRRHHHRITIDALTLCTSEWEEKQGLPFATICRRLNDGWCERCSVMLPPAPPIIGPKFIRSGCPHRTEEVTAA